ncbi:hypothetical protein EMPG_13025 [Blastomyces silverae]|uniref:Uncharacterized protein n=1 Tax=Blastomyces silverae TaxID=2060906 RepID=A0A0H1BJZ7_9EURO|nr:hypothetical protein EMPG_13025 [Blastomyces silverae]
MAFLFTVLGEWYVEGKVISKCEYKRITILTIVNPLLLDFAPTLRLANFRGAVLFHLEATWLGMCMVLGGIALCVYSKMQ